MLHKILQCARKLLYRVLGITSPSLYYINLAKEYIEKERDE